MVVGVRDGDECWLGAMWVPPARRREGVGAALTSAVIDWARSWQARQVMLGVAQSNTPAAALFESLGFVETGKQELVREDLVEVEYVLDLETGHP
jgi:GNAT superfamily N-acetyltransferase